MYWITNQLKARHHSHLLKMNLNIFFGTFFGAESACRAQGVTPMKRSEIDYLSFSLENREFNKWKRYLASRVLGQDPKCPVKEDIGIFYNYGPSVRGTKAQRPVRSKQITLVLLSGLPLNKIRVKVVANRVHPWVRTHVRLMLCCQLGMHSCLPPCWPHSLRRFGPWCRTCSQSYARFIRGSVYSLVWGGIP